jgi:hypothetical protein
VQVHNSSGKRINKAVTIAGKKQLLSLCRLVFKLDRGTQWPPPLDTLLPESNIAAAPAAKKNNKKKQKRSGPSQVRQAACSGDILVAGAKKVLSEEVQSVRGGIFDLEAVREPLSETGRYGKLSRQQDMSC